MCIKATKRFLRASSCLPEVISTKLPEIIADIEKNHPPDACRIRQGGFWRTHITMKYRLFYRYDELACLCLLDLRRRDKDTYQNIEFLTQSSLFSITEEISQEENGNRKVQDFLSKEQIQQCDVPPECHDYLLSLKNEEELLYSTHQVPDQYILRIIDTLDRTIESVSKETYYEIVSSESLVDLCRSGELNKFLLNLSDEQRRILELDCDHPILINGGPGTGKSILAIYRVKKLVESGVTNILLTTHTETLVDYFKQLLEELLPDSLDRLGVSVCKVDDIVDKYIGGNKTTIASEEISQLCLQSIMANAESDQHIQNKLRQLGESSILEEILKTIESRGITDSNTYEQISEIAKGEPCRRDLRRAVWDIYLEWVDLLKKSGYTTIEQSRRQALDTVSDLIKKPYNAIIIDEAQDLSPTALRFLVQLVEPSGLFLTADTSQSLYEKVFCWNFVQKEIGCRPTIRTLTESFRNTREIGKACPKILTKLSDRRNSVSNFSSVSGRKPKIILTDDLIKQLQSIIEFFKDAAQRWKLPISAGAILVPNELMGLFITNQLNHSRLRAKWLDRKIAEPDEQGYIKVLSLHAAKGLEFPFVVIIGLEQIILPSSDRDQREIRAQERRLFYVGCSRAMRSLLVCGSRSNPSDFIRDLDLQYWKKEEV
jgi:superfamily I DNA/RNA helicase